MVTCHNLFPLSRDTVELYEVLPLFATGTSKEYRNLRAVCCHGTKITLVAAERNPSNSSFRKSMDCLFKGNRSKVNTAKIIKGKIIVKLIIACIGARTVTWCHFKTSSAKRDITDYALNPTLYVCDMVCDDQCDRWFHLSCVKVDRKRYLALS